MYSHGAFALLALSLALGLAATLTPDRPLAWRGAADSDALLLAVAAIGLGALNIASTHLFYADTDRAGRWLVWLALGGWLATLAGCANRRLRGAALALCFL